MKALLLPFGRKSPPRETPSSFLIQANLRGERILNFDFMVGTLRKKVKVSVRGVFIRIDED
jgi:hypothetical protein